MLLTKIILESEGTQNAQVPLSLGCMRLMETFERFRSARLKVKHTLQKMGPKDAMGYPESLEEQILTLWKGTEKVI